MFATRLRIVLKSTLAVLLVAAVFSIWHGSSALAATSYNVSGTVLDQSQQGVIGVTVTAVATDGSGTQTTVTTIGGAYTLALASDTYNISFTPPTSDNANPVTESDVVVNSNQTININFTPALATLSGNVSTSLGSIASYLAGDPYPLTVSLVTPNGTIAGSATVDPSGNYAVTATAGTYNVELVTSEYSSTTGSVALESVNAVTLSSNTTLNLQLNLVPVVVTVQGSTSTLSGATVIGVDAGGSTVLGGMTFNPADNPNVGTATSTSGITDSTGVTTLYFPLGIQGQVCTTVQSQVYCAPFTATAGGSSATIMASPQTTFSGTLTDSLGDNISGASIYLVPDGSSITGASGYSVPVTNGTFSAQVNPGYYTITSIGGISVTTSNGFYEAGLASNSGVPIDLMSNFSQNMIIPIDQVNLTLNDATGGAVPDIQWVAFTCNFVETCDSEAAAGSVALWAGGPTFSESGFGQINGSATAASNGTAVLDAIQGINYNITESNTPTPISTNLIATGPTNIVFTGQFPQLLLPPSAPNSVSATSSAEGQAIVNWTMSQSGSGQITSYTVTATDMINASGSVAPITILPASDGTLATTYTFTGLSPNDVYEFLVDASNAYGSSAATQSAAIVIDGPPIFVGNLPGSVTINEGQTLPTINVSVIGTPAPTFTLDSSSTLPNGITVSFNGGVAIISGMPLVGTAQTNPYTVVLDASNGIGGQVQYVFTITVTANASPLSIIYNSTGSNIINITTGTGSQIVPVTFTANGYATNGYKAPGLSIPGNVIDGLTFADQGNGTAILSGKPQYAGSYQFTVTAALKNNSISQAYTLNVYGISITSPSTLSVKRGAAFSLQVKYSDYPVSPATYSWVSSAPSWITFDSTTGVVSGVAPTNATKATYTVTVYASGADGVASQTLTISVN